MLIVRQLCACSAESKDGRVSRLDGSRDRLGLVILVENLPADQVQGAIGNIEYCNELSTGSAARGFTIAGRCVRDGTANRSDHLPGTDTPCVRNWTTGTEGASSMGVASRSSVCRFDSGTSERALKSYLFRVLWSRLNCSDLTSSTGKTPVGPFASPFTYHPKTLITLIPGARTRSQFQEIFSASLTRS